MASIDYSTINKKLKRFIQYFDNMAWNIFNSVYEDLDKYEARANIDRENRTMYITCSDFEITYYTNSKYFAIEVFVSKKHFSDNNPVIISHKIYEDGNHILDIYDGTSTDKYTGICINETSFIKEADLEQINFFIKKVNGYFNQWYIKNEKSSVR